MPVGGGWWVPVGWWDWRRSCSAHREGARGWAGGWVHAGGCQWVGGPHPHPRTSTGHAPHSPPTHQHWAVKRVHIHVTERGGLHIHHSETTARQAPKLNDPINESETKSLVTEQTLLMLSVRYLSTVVTISFSHTRPTLSPLIYATFNETDSTKLVQPKLI